MGVSAHLGLRLGEILPAKGRVHMLAEEREVAPHHIEVAHGLQACSGNQCV